MLTLVAHLAFMQPIPSGLYLWIVQNVAQFWGGVHLFFVISGFVIARGFLDDFSTQSAPSPADFRVAWKRFYVRRFFRIVPTSMTWIAIVVTFAITYNAFGSFGTLPSVFTQAAAAALFIYNALVPWIAGAALGVYWSLALEEQFYLLFPLVARRRRQVIYRVMVGIILVLFFVHRPANQNLILVSFPVDALAWGVLIAMAQKDRLLARFEPTFLNHPTVRLANFALTLVVITVIGPVLLRDVFFGTAVLELGAAWLIFCASFGKGYVLPPSPLRPATRLIGQASYSLYLCHIPAYLVARETLLRFGMESDALTIHLASLTIALVVLCLFAAASFRFVEKPTRKLGKSLGAARLEQEHHARSASTTVDVAEVASGPPQPEKPKKSTSY